MAVRGTSPIETGVKGRGVASAYINSNGHLMVQYDDANSTTQDAGVVSPGASVRVGNGPPAASSGNTGDVYVDALTGDLYRKDP